MYNKTYGILGFLFNIMGTFMSVKSILFLTISFLSTEYILADMRYDGRTCRYSSIPASAEINQNDYHLMVWTCKDIKNRHSAMVHQSLMSGCNRGSSFSESGAQVMITEYLQRIATPTSIRLLEDLRKKNFAF